MTKRMLALLATLLASAAAIAASPSIVQRLTGKCPLCIANTVCEFFK